MTFTNNLFVAALGYEHHLPMALHLWTISLEEQFYLLIPFLMPVAATLRTKQIWATAVGVLLFLGVTRFAAIALGARSPFIYTSPLRFDAFVLGMALGLGAGEGWLRKWPGTLLVIGGLSVLVLCGAFGQVRHMRFDEAIIYWFVDIGCLLVVAGCLQPGVFVRMLSYRPLAYLGKISFGIYVYHIVFLWMLSKLWGEDRNP